jgi:hypothetical protein
VDEYFPVGKGNLHAERDPSAELRDRGQDYAHPIPGVVGDSPTGRSTSAVMFSLTILTQ